MKKITLFTLLISASFALNGCSFFSTQQNQNNQEHNLDNEENNNNPSGDNNSESNNDENENQNPNVDDNDGDDNEHGTEEQHEEASSTFELQGAPILHAWNWSLDNIKNELSNIYNAGYKAIQISPMQPQKDKYDGRWEDQWWKLYQPLGFKIAESNQSVLGDKNQLKSLCESADRLGIDIIVDVVANHLAEKNGHLHDDIQNFEREIYSKSLIHSYSSSVIGDSNQENILHGRLGGLPDLQTENSYVQQRVVSLLKDYISVGVKGFRFDAAKHIETPEDGIYASDFWPTVLNSTTQYATSLGKDKPYYYGEVLNSPGNNREWSYYTKRMSTIDNKQAQKVINAVVSGNPSLIQSSYTGGNKAVNLVLWAESHDTYANDEKETTNISDSDIDLAYLIQASRRDASLLYFARPIENKNIGNIGKTNYKNNSIKAANLFHTHFANSKESLSYSGKVFTNIRGEGEDIGAAIVNLGNDQGKIDINLPNGSYKNIETGSTVNITNGQLNVNFSKNALYLIAQNVDINTTKPTITMQSNKEVFKDTANVTISVDDATSCSYSINGGSKVSFESSTNLTVGNGLGNGKITITVTANNKNGTSTKTLTLHKSSFADKSLLIKNVPSTYSYCLWGWNSDSDGKFYNFDKENDIIAIDIPTNNYIVVEFPSGTSATNANWSNKIRQTEDLQKANKQSIMDYTTINWKTN